jgi:hypothetical protein
MPDCPHCGAALTLKHLRVIARTLTAEQRRKLGGMLFQSTRKTRAGGRPLSTDPRCACGKYTLATAGKRGHVCEGVP